MNARQRRHLTRMVRRRSQEHLRAYVTFKVACWYRVTYRTPLDPGGSSRLGRRLAWLRDQMRNHPEARAFRNAHESRNWTAFMWVLDSATGVVQAHTRSGWKIHDSKPSRTP